MTSSLVGSEMCIRDSPLLMLFNRVSQRRTPERLTKSRAHGRRPLCLVAVSYTHLTLPTICSV
eukprot:1710970-Prorocentrum_lima.AAC.1